MKYIGLGKAFAKWCASTGVTEAAKASTAHHARYVELMATKYLSDLYIAEVQRAGVQRSMELERELMVLRTTVRQCTSLSAKVNPQPFRVYSVGVNSPIRARTRTYSKF